ncbi:MAG: YeeE/YedE thiosulfate transporter family protein [Eubacteriales bacterium]|nr:YeeE/YedE thiosulfate transporter family protein [Eubacteriales bacterium]
MKKSFKEPILGAIVFVVAVILGLVFLEQKMYTRLFIGMAIGYILTRGFFGFAGSVNRAYNTGSTKLMRSLMYLFVISAIITIAFVYNDVGTLNAETDKMEYIYRLSVNPINLGLLVGGLLFGFGMALSMCCASGSLTDLVASPWRGGTTLIFFCIGVFVGYPLQNSASWVTTSWVTSGSRGKGVFLPDLFPWDPMRGFLASLVVTLLLAGLVIYLSKAYENYRKKQNTFSLPGSEAMQEKIAQGLDQDKSWYYRIFAKPFTLNQAIVAFALCYVALMYFFKSGWGVTTPFGYAFGGFLKLFGVSSEALEAYTKAKPGFFDTPFFSNGVNVQNMGIVVGTLVAFLLMNIYKETVMEEIRITPREVLVYMLGGFTMGIGSRLANGCNAGALFTPIAHFSLSAWVFLIVLVVGGTLGNMAAKKLRP